jgi:energy-coupling factor transport system ATP-binding protein
MVLSVENLSLSLGKNRENIFRDVSFNLDEGETALLTGKAGSGKTMLGLSLCGYLPLWIGDYELSGKIVCFGKQIEQGDYPPDAGILLENPYTQLSGLKGSVLQEMAFPLECRGIPRDGMLPVIEQYAALLGVSHILDHSAHSLSGGELQRVLVACTLMSRPRFLFLDRPLTEIDTFFRPVLMNIFREHVDSLQGAALLAEDPWLMPGETFQKTVNLSTETVRYTPSEGITERARKKPDGGILRAEELSFAFPGGRKILEHFSFSVGEGEIVFVTGPNGAGKTTLARIIAGILAPQKGEIYYAGRPGKNMKLWEKAAIVGFAMQNSDLHFSRRTVSAELSLGGEGFHPPGELLEILGLDKLFEKHPLELSQAEKKRLVMALALGKSRRIVMLDEPSQYQDEEGFHRLTEAVRFTTKEGKSFLIITHDPRLFQSFPDACEISL